MLTVRVKQGDTVNVSDGSQHYIGHVVRGNKFRALVQWFKRDPKSGRHVLCRQWVNQPKE